MSGSGRVDLAEASWAFGASETGKRERDEDYVACDEFDSIRVGVLCDGMGGGQSGELASEIAARVFITGVRRVAGELANSWSDDEARHEAYAEVIGHCHESVEGITGEGGVSGTTLTAVVATLDKGDTSSIDMIHIGDSRCYRVLDGRADLLTDDHSVTGDMVRAEYIKMHEIEETSGRNTLTKNIGDEGSSKADISTIGPGGVFLLCCDGVWGPLHGVSGLWLSDSDICSQEMASGMVEKAIERGSSDNCSVLIIDLGA